MNLRTGTCIKPRLVVLAPLPISSQFLNVIESVFSGLAKTVLHNSDYETISNCQNAIDLYFKKAE